MKYVVSLVHNNVYQSNLAEAESPLAVMAWYKMYKPDARILSVSEASADDDKPGKPCITVKQNYLPYIHAASNMTMILEREKGMHCIYYIMDQRYMDSLACPRLSHDNHGAPLMVGVAYVIVTCSNGHKYYICVDGDSVVTMCAEVFDFIQNK